MAVAGGTTVTLRNSREALSALRTFIDDLRDQQQNMTTIIIMTRVTYGFVYYSSLHSLKAGVTQETPGEGA